MNGSMPRPVINEYQNLPEFIGDMLKFRKTTDKSFSVLQMSKKLRRVSPALVSLIVAGKRRVTADRVDELSKLLDLNSFEKSFLRDHFLSDDRSVDQPDREHSRKQTSSHLLQDWVNVFVKDAALMEGVNGEIDRIHTVLAGIATKPRIEKSLRFLYSHGYLRRNEKGQCVEEIPLHVVDEKISDFKVRQFHASLLGHASRCLKTVPIEQRYANALILSVDEEGYHQLKGLISEFTEKLQAFAEAPRRGNRLYQLIVNLSPTGGKSQ
jgi:uncharacterized protein (TIGR02147 family)